MRVLLLNPPNLEEAQLDAHTIPLGLVCIREFLVEEGYDVATINLYFSDSWSSVESILKIQEFDVVGIPCYTMQRHSVFKLLELCKSINREAVTVLGGPHATFLDKIILSNEEFIDYIIREEGEYTFLELLQALENNDLKKICSIEGLTHRSEGRIFRNPSRSGIKDLSNLPAPRYSKEELESVIKCDALTFHFLNVAKEAKTQSIGTILASRGCSNSCVFCCNGAYWNGQVYYPVQYAYEQIKDVYDNFGTNLFDFYDDDFTHSQTYVSELCDLIIKNNLAIFWWCSSRAQNLSKELLSQMKSAGCFMISYGMESGSQRILDEINKDLTVREAIEVFKSTKESGIDIRLTISIGHGSEDIESINETIQLIKNVKPRQVAIYLVKLYPGTPLYDKAKQLNFANDGYWFDRSKTDALFYTAESSLDQLVKYRDLIKEQLEPYASETYENKSLTIEMNLDWG